MAAVLQAQNPVQGEDRAKAYRKNQGMGLQNATTTRPDSYGGIRGRVARLAGVLGAVSDSPNHGLVQGVIRQPPQGLRRYSPRPATHALVCPAELALSCDLLTPVIWQVRLVRPELTPTPGD